MHDPMTQVYSNRLFTIWHKDPCNDRTDDSCGWFMRSRHGDKKVLEKIVSQFRYHWDTMFVSEDSGKVYLTGLFSPAGEPHLSVIGITLNLFWYAAFEYFGKSHKKANKYLQKHLFDIMFFAENPVDSLFNSITLKFGDEDRESRIKDMANIIYGYLLRSSRPWYKHPRFHLHHWRIQLNYRFQFQKSISAKANVGKG